MIEITHEIAILTTVVFSLLMYPILRIMEKKQEKKGEMAVRSVKSELEEKQ